MNAVERWTVSCGIDHAARSKKIQRLSAAGKHTRSGMVEGEMRKDLMEAAAF